MLDCGFWRVVQRSKNLQSNFQAAGYPIGSGSVESGNKVVVEARLKGAGMHWARPHVNPMVALRDILGSARWEEDWPQLATRVREQHLQERQQQQRARRSAHPTVGPPSANATPLSPPYRAPLSPTRIKGSTRKQRALPPIESKPPSRPSANHPWRHSPIGRARFKPYRSGPDPKS